MNRLDFANHASLNLGDATTHRVKRGPLVAHLGADAVLLREIAKITSFADRTGQRLLGVRVLAVLERFRRDDRVHVVRGRNRNGVDLVHHFGVQIFVVRVGLAAGEFLRFALKRFAVDVADRNDFAVKARLRDVAGAFAANADTGDR